MSGKSDVALIGRWMEVVDAPLVQSFKVCGGHLTFANMVQNIYERSVLLSVNLFQFDGDILCLPQGIRTEEVRRVVVGFQQCLVGGCHHGGELLEVAYQQQLDTSEGSSGVAEATHDIIYCVEQVASHHRHLVDDQQVECAQQFLLLFREIVPLPVTRLWNVWRQRQLEERVDGLPTSINGGNTRRCHHHHSFWRPLLHLFEECCLACSCLSCQENAHSGVLNEVPCQLQFGVVLHWLLFIIIKEFLSF